MASTTDASNDWIQVVKGTTSEVVKLEDVTTRAVPISSQHMIHALAFTYRSVMARRTVVSNPRVIKDRPYKGRRVHVTNTAILVCYHVINVFTRRDHTVVTRCAGNEINNSRIMIKGTRGKGTAAR